MQAIQYNLVMQEFPQEECETYLKNGIQCVASHFQNKGLQEFIYNEKESLVWLRFQSNSSIDSQDIENLLIRLLSKVKENNYSSSQMKDYRHMNILVENIELDYFLPEKQNFGSKVKI